MEHRKILNLLNEANDSKFFTRKWNTVNDQSYGKDGDRNEVLYNTEAQKPNLCDYNNAYILVKGNIIVTTAPEIQISFKNCASFFKCLTKILEMQQLLCH